VIAGRYVLEREIGRGGMGVVWLARDEVLARGVAIKRIASGPASDPRALRAHREARLAATMNHPNVVSVLDLVTDGDEQWLVMEYVDGVTLTELVRRRGPLTPDRAAPLFARVADALAAAHASRIVHRDVKPSNILVARDGQVKLSDFGIATAAGDDPLTQTGMLIGSPAYLAPEVATGASASPASDVWSLGASLYLALTGTPAYDSDSNVLATLHRIVNEPPPRHEGAGWLTPLLEGTMTLDPAQRWPMSRVREFLANGPAGAIADSTQELPVSPSARRGPTGGSIRLAAIGLLVVLLAVLVIGVLVSGWPGGGSGGDTAGGSAGASPSAASPSTSANTPSRAGMEAFITTYLDTATTDQRASWAMLTPAFRDSSGTFGRYKKSWRSRPIARPSNIVADPRALTISYDVSYRDAEGNKLFDDRPTLQLTYSDGMYLIDGEA
jgi:eukaryotic-like serine/threonine-protein kinase